MLKETGASAFPCPAKIRCELSEQQARHGIGRLPGPDGSWKDSWSDRGRCQTVIADDATGLVDDEDGCEALLLVR
jgi:hypothetical protein